MHLKCRNCNDAFRRIVLGVYNSEAGRLGSMSEHFPTYRTVSRNGPVIQIAEPVIITYEKPRERVLFNKARDANPVFHVFEALWMLAGRNDIEPLCRYVKTYAQFSDDGKTANGAYGYRWHQAKIADVWNTDAEPLQDQLKVIVDHLKRKPESRRAVLSMWNVEDDLLKIDTSKDVCCNLNAMFSIRTQLGVPANGVGATYCDGPHQAMNCPHCVKDVLYLDMTVTNRSNDTVWGALGANVVHFSFLQEYLAAAIGVEVGLYNQISNNLHVYTETNGGWHPDEWLAEYSPKLVCEKCFGEPCSVKAYVGQGSCESCGEHSYYLRTQAATYGWDEYKHEPFPFVANPETFDKEVAEFIDNKDWTRVWEEPFLNLVASPMCWAHELYRRKDYAGALKAAELIEATDWREAATNWLTKRKEKHDGKLTGHRIGDGSGVN